jgi:hypothetical protein
MCKQSGEDINHLFLHCSFSKSVWHLLTHRLHIKSAWSGASFLDCWDSWTKDFSVSNRLAAITCWNIWISRNKTVFEDKPPCAWEVVYRILNSFQSAPSSKTKQLTRQRPIQLKTGFACAQFDGASSTGGINCGVGGYILDLDSSKFRWLINCGEGQIPKQSYWVLGLRSP